MLKLTAVTVLTICLACVAQAQTTDVNPDDVDGGRLTPGSQNLTADGAWDCSDDAGNYLGTIVVADLSYAFIGPQGEGGQYGKLHRDSYNDAPGFLILSGALKDQFGAVGMGLRGPGKNEQDYSDLTKLVMNVVVTEKNMFQCARRMGP